MRSWSWMTEKRKINKSVSHIDIKEEKGNVFRFGHPNTSLSSSNFNKELEYRTNKYDEKVILKNDMKIERERAELLKDMSKILNVFLSNSAYHDKNIAKQNSNFDKLNVPKDEREVVKMVWDFKHNQALIGLINMKSIVERLNMTTIIINKKYDKYVNKKEISELIKDEEIKLTKLKNMRNSGVEYV